MESGAAESQPNGARLLRQRCATAATADVNNWIEQQFFDLRCHFMGIMATTRGGWSCILLVTINPSRRHNKLRLAVADSSRVSLSEGGKTVDGKTVDLLREISLYNHLYSPMRQTTNEVMNNKTA